MPKETKEKQKVLPSDEIATVEEFMGGAGTYEKDGKVYVSTMGKLILDDREMKAEVIPLNPLAVIRKGHEVFAVITGIRSQMVTARAVAIEGINRAIAGDDMLSLHVSKVSTEYIKDVSRYYRIGDIIRAKVIAHDPSLQIATDGKKYGAIKSYCMKCRQALTQGKVKLECKDCQRFETRKTAQDYGFVKFEK